ncbi:MAG: hypothetical protein QG641_874 [Candidatus Poribacteria bacterium]|nr:hypothetical protein [Candidatus Poribacteria bacterium]
MPYNIKSIPLILKIFIVILLLLLPVSAYAFLSGPLFPYSVVKPGFSKLELERATIFYPNGTQLLDDYLKLDDMITETEAFHNIHFKKNVSVIVCATSEQYKRFSTKHAHACAMPTGTIIYINPSIYNTGRDLTGFLKHELSHAILFQNTSLLKAFKLKSWVTEGLAVYYGNSHHYFQNEELRKLSIDKGYFFNLLDEKAEPVDIPSEIKYKFIYGEYRAFMGYLIKTYGSQAVLDYIFEYAKQPDKENELFNNLLGNSLAEAFAEFHKEMINGEIL